jgi:hypothetical protein
LPYDIFAEITKILIDDGCYRTAANLNEASRAIREETLFALYETLVVYDETKLDKALQVGATFFKYTKSVQLFPCQKQ